MVKVNQKIFVQIASYRDPELQPTLDDLYEKAKYPDKINVGICLQVMQDDGADCRVSDTDAYPGEIRIKEVNARESRGACWARVQTQALWDDEAYILQIDSHMRFMENWDETIVKTLSECPSDKAVLSCYPPGYSIEDNGQVKLDKRNKFWGIVASRFDSKGILLLKNRRSHRSVAFPNAVAPRPIPGGFVGGCFLFSTSDFIAQFPYDPYLYFFGEEISLSARIYTKGWDIFYPHLPIMFHKWERERPIHWEDNKYSSPFLNKISKQRVKFLLGTIDQATHEIIKDLDKYGLGTVRTLEEYQEYIGVNFKTLEILPRARELKL